MNGRPILIVGAGIAGPALAIALRRAGYDTVVYESMPQPRDDAGAFLNIAPNGARPIIPGAVSGNGTGLLSGP